MNELESRINQLAGNMLGIQTLLLSIVATSPRRNTIVEHFIAEARHTHATLLAESSMPDEVLHQLDHWYATTVTALMEEVAESAPPTDTTPAAPRSSPDAH